MNETVTKVITFEEHYLCPETDAAHLNGEKLLGLS